jgi:hypothetical protein
MALALAGMALAIAAMSLTLPLLLITDGPASTIYAELAKEMLVLLLGYAMHSLVQPPEPKG